jgi:hypothetical protein
MGRAPVELLDDFFPLLVSLSGPRVDATEVRQMSECFEKVWRRGERYALLSLTPRNFELPDGAGRRLISEWIHHPRVRDFTRRQCVGAASVNDGVLYRIVFKVIMTFDRPVTEMRCVPTLQEGLDFCVQRMQRERLPFDRPADLVRHELLKRLSDRL